MTKPSAPANGFPKQPMKQFKWQRVDRLLDLRLDDPIIDEDAQALAQIRESYRKNSITRGYWGQLKKLPSLYTRLRGPRFPLKPRKGSKAKRWRSLSPWMKVQVGTLALAEAGYMMFVVHIHDELRNELDASGRDQKNYLRDRITRCAKSTFGDPRWFFFVMEDLTPDGDATRPHAHGAIEVRPHPLPTRGNKGHLKFRRMAERDGLEHAEKVYGLLLTKVLLKTASGNRKGDRPKIVASVNQARNVWTSTPKRPFLNDNWVNYAFKNTKTFSATLGEQRLAFSQSLRTEARKVWQLMRIGEKEISQWE